MDHWLNATVYGLGLAAATAAATRLRSLDAAWRCRLWAAALAGLALLMMRAAVEMAGDVASSLASASSAVLPGVPAAAAAGQAPLLRLPALAVPTACLLVVWAGAAAWRVGVLGAAILRIRRARRAVMPFPSGRAEGLAAWAAASQGRIMLALSDRIPGAAMLGFGRPIVAIPPSWTGFDAAVLDAVLAHECAHAERRDDLAQLAAELLLAVSWCHPAAWWMARQAEFEREAACDERAARHTNARGYARCLVTIAEACRPGGGAALVPSTLARASQLARRVERLLDERARQPRGAARLVALGAVAVTVLAVHGSALPPVFGLMPTPAGASGVTSAAPALNRMERIPLPVSVQPAGASGERAIDPPRPVDDASRAAGALPGSAVPASGPPAAGIAPSLAREPAAAPVSAMLPSRPFDQVLSTGDLVTQAPPTPPRAGASPYRVVGSAVGRAGRWTSESLSRAGARLGASFSPR